MATEQQHTPGPWVYEEPAGLYRDPTAYVVRTTQGWQSSVAQVVPEGTAEANARLIAAAPDLLAFAGSVVRVLDGHEGDAGDGIACRLCKLTNEAKGILAKALGESNRVDG